MKNPQMVIEHQWFESGDGSWIEGGIQMSRTAKKWLLTCMPIVFFCMMGSTFAQERYSEMAYIGFPEQDSTILRALSLDGLFREVSHEKRIALLYHPSTLRDISNGFLVSTNLQASPRKYSSEEISNMVTMRFNPKTRLYEITVTADTQNDALKLCRAVVKYYEANCRIEAQRELHLVTQSIDQCISATLDILEEQKKHNSKKTQKDIRGEITVTAYEDILHRLIMAKTALQLEDRGMMTGWLPLTTALTVP